MYDLNPYSDIDFATQIGRPRGPQRRRQTTDLRGILG